MSNTAQTTKALAQKIAKQMAQEPLELLKSARNQVTGQEYSESQQQEQQYDPDQQAKIQHEQAKAQDNAKSSRLIEAFQRELEDVRKQNLLKKLQQEIAEGKVIPLEDYPELSLEHKQVLKAQMEAVAMRMANAKKENAKSGIIEVVAKKGRQMMGAMGKKTAMKREQTHVEKPVPPSG